jgi:hypothetical protein
LEKAPSKLFVKTNCQLKNLSIFNYNKTAMKKLLPLILIILAVNFAKAQCAASFTYANVGNGTVSFTSTSVGTTSSTEYAWSFGDGATFQATNNILASHTYTANGNYTVNLYIQDSTINCGSGSSLALVVSNACTAAASFSMQKDTTAMPAIVWNAMPNYPGNISAANWSWGDGSNTNGLYPSHTYSAAGTYDICLTITVSCGATATICANPSIFKMANAEQNAMAVLNVISNPSGIKQISKEKGGLSLFPNPNNGEFEIRLTGEAVHTNICIYSALGTKVFQTTTDKSTLALDLKSLAEGAYFVKVEPAQGKTSYSKFIISR